MIIQLRRVITHVVVVSLLGIGLPLPAQATLVTTDAALGGSAERTKVMVLLDRADVQRELQAYGVSPSDVKARVAAMSDDEVAALAGKIDSLSAGGDIGILGVILVVFLVLLLTDILGFTRIFPFTRPVR
jgi:uncharacterized protein DUF6627